MSLVASSISGAAYVLNNAEDKDTGNGFEVGIWFLLFFPYHIRSSLHKTMTLTNGSLHEENDGRNCYYRSSLDLRWFA
jgi:hypothetical protein